MTAKDQRRIESVRGIINIDEVNAEILRSETRIVSSKDSIGDFLYVLSFGLMIGWTNILTAAWHGHDFWTASWHGLQLSLAVFAFFSLYRHIMIMLRLRPEEDYKRALSSRRGELTARVRDAELIIKASGNKKLPETTKEEFE